jgi:hypothetical protein
VQFHDGAELTSEDGKATYDRIAASDASCAPAFGDEWRERFFLDPAIF